MQQGGTRVLLADIGGTNARFALADCNAPMPLLDDSVREFSVVQFPSLADAARQYLRITGAQGRHAVFAVAGRVEGDQARITNHPWLISREQTRRRSDWTRCNWSTTSMPSVALPLLRRQDSVPSASLAGGHAYQDDRTWR